MTDSWSQVQWLARKVTKRYQRRPPEKAGLNDWRPLREMPLDLLDEAAMSFAIAAFCSLVILAILEKVSPPDTKKEKKQSGSTGE
jgi:hypothetical protein